MEPFKFGYGCVAHGDLGGADKNCPFFKGTMYVRNNQVALSGDLAVYGIIYADNGIVGNGNITFYLDDTQGMSASSSASGSLNQTSWQELAPVPF